MGLASTLSNPPGWDAIWGLFVPAIELERSNFDLPWLLEQGSFRDYGPNTHATSSAVLGLAVLSRIFGFPGALWGTHLISILSLATIGAVTYLTVCRYRDRTTALLAAAVTLTSPVMLQQAADAYLELPLALVLLVAFSVSLQGKPIPTAIAAFVATSIKLTGLVGVPLVFLAARLRSWSVWRSALLAGVSGLPAVGVFLLSKGHESASAPEFALTLLHRSAGILATTIDVLLLLILRQVAAILVFRSRSTDQAAVNVMKTSAWTIVSFALLLIASIVVSRELLFLARYYAVLVPILSIAVLIGLSTRGVRTAWLVGAVTIVVFLANSQGAISPGPTPAIYVGAERSLEAQDVLGLQREGVDRLVESGLPIVAMPNVYFRLAYPELGYVSTPPTMVMTLEEAGELLPSTFVVLDEAGDRDRGLEAIVDRAQAGGSDVVVTQIRVGNVTSDLIEVTRPASPQ